MAQLDETGIPESIGIQLWEKKRKELWEGWNEIKDPKSGETIREANEGMRRIIWIKWETNIPEHTFSHWTFLEPTGQHLDKDVVISKLAKLGITRDNCPLFDEYCIHLESKPTDPQRGVSQQGVITTRAMDKVLGG